VIFYTNFWIRRVVKLGAKKVKRLTIWDGGSTFYLYFFWTLGSKEMYKSLCSGVRTSTKCYVRIFSPSHCHSYFLDNCNTCAPLLADYQSVMFIPLLITALLVCICLFILPWALVTLLCLTLALWMTTTCFGWWMRKPCRIWWYKQVLNKVWMI